MNAQVTIINGLLIPEIWDEPIVESIGYGNRIIKHGNGLLYTIENTNSGDKLNSISDYIIKRWLIPQLRTVLEFDEINKAMFSTKHTYTVMRVNQRIEMVILYQGDNAIIMSVQQAKELLNKLESVIT